MFVLSDEIKATPDLHALKPMTENTFSYYPGSSPIGKLYEAELVVDGYDATLILDLLGVDAFLPQIIIDWADACGNPTVLRYTATHLTQNLKLMAEQLLEGKTYWHKDQLWSFGFRTIC